MRLLLVAAAFALFASHSNIVQAEEDISPSCARVIIVKGFTYNQFLDMGPTAQMNHMTGWLTGFSSGIGVFSKECSNRISACMDATTNEQRLAMLEKYARDRPQNWGQQHVTSLFMWVSIVSPCFSGNIPLN